LSDIDLKAKSMKIAMTVVSLCFSHRIHIELHIHNDD